MKGKAITSIHTVGTVLDFEEDYIFMDGERIEKDQKPTWRAIKARLWKDVEKKRKEEYLEKQMQSEICRKQEERFNLRLKQNLPPRKTAWMMTMLEQILETKSWETSRGRADFVTNIRKQQSIFSLDVKC